MLLRYEYENGRYAFAIPFAFQKESDIGVRLVLPSGRERVLCAGTDYAIADSHVIYVLPPRHSLIIYLDAPAPQTESSSLAAHANPVLPTSVDQLAQPDNQAAAACLAQDSRICRDSIAPPNSPRGDLSAVAPGTAPGNLTPSALSQAVSSQPGSASPQSAASPSPDDGTLNFAQPLSSAEAQRAAPGLLAPGQALGQPDGICLSSGQVFTQPGGSLSSGQVLVQTSGPTLFSSQALDQRTGLDSVSAPGNAANVNESTYKSPRGDFQASPALTTVSAMAAATGSNQGSATVSGILAANQVAAAPGQVIAASRLDELEQKLDALLTARASAEAEALLQARALARDSHIGALEEAGAKQLKQFEERKLQAMENLDELARVCEQALGRKANALSAAQVNADDSIARARTATAEISTAASQAMDAAQTLESSVNEAVEKLSARVAELEEKIDNQAERATKAVSLAALEAEEQVAQASARAQADASRANSLAGQAWPEQGWMAQADALAARSIMPLPEPLSYYPGRNSLYIARNGIVQTLGREFEEVGTSARLSNTIRLLIPSNKGDIWSFWIAPTSQAQAASLAAQEASASAEYAASSATNAANALGNVQSLADKALTQGAAQLNGIATQGAQATRNVGLARDNALDEIKSLGGNERKETALFWQAAKLDIRKEAETSSQDARDLWQDAQRGIAKVREEAQARAESAAQEAERKAKSASRACAANWELAQCAWRAAFQASLDRAMPGIGSVGEYQDLAGRPSGLYIINPRVKQPLPFMGVFPIEKIEDALGYDGIFLVGAQPYPDAPALPDLPYPDEPSQVPEMQPPAAHGQWLPCNHSHH